MTIEVIVNEFEVIEVIQEGPQGPQGTNGINGIDGIDGEDGANGIDGDALLTTVKSGATQVAASAGVNELWRTASHATLPDGVVMIGI